LNFRTGSQLNVRGDVSDCMDDKGMQKPGGV
jgi:hypothetical protein